MMQSPGRQMLNGLSWQYINIFSIALLQLGVLAVLARLLTPEAYGLVSLAMIFVGLVNSFSQLGVGPAIVQYSELTQYHVRAGFTLTVFLGCLMTMVVWASAPLLATVVDNEEVAEILRWLSFTFLATSFGTVAEAQYIRRLQFNKLFWVDVGSYLLGYALVGVIMALLGYGVFSLVGAMLGQSVIRSLMLLLLSRHSIKPLFSLFHSRKLLHFGGGYTLAGIMNYIANVGDNFIVGKVLGVGPLGLYTRAYQLMQLPATYFGLAIQKVSFPALSKLQNDIQRLARAYFTSAAVVALVCIPMTVLMVVIAPEIITVLLGTKWSGVIDPFRILGLGIFFRTAYKIDHSTTSALGAVYKRSLVDFTYAVVVLVAAFSGLRWGISGVAAGVLIAIILNYVLSVSLSLRLLRRTWPEILILVGPGLIMGLVVALIALPVRFVLVNTGLPAVIVLILTPLLSALGMLTVVALKPRVLGAYGMLALSTVLDAVPVRFVPRLIRQWAGENLAQI